MLDAGESGQEPEVLRGRELGRAVSRMETGWDPRFRKRMSVEGPWPPPPEARVLISGEAWHWALHDWPLSRFSC